MRPDDQAYPRYWGTQDPGLTKRELAILMAMQGLCGSPEQPSTLRGMAEAAVLIADATLAAMQEQKG